MPLSRLAVFRRDATPPLIFPSIRFLFISYLLFFPVTRLLRWNVFAIFLQRNGRISADKTSFLAFLQANCLRSVQTIQGLEKVFDL